MQGGMTDPAALTDEELAEWWNAAWRHPSDVRRLIAEVERLREANQRLEGEAALWATR